MTNEGDKSRVSCRKDTSSNDDEVDEKKLPSSYTYWKRDIDDAHVLPPTVPQKIEPSNDLKHASSSHASQWNQGGTYEEKNCSQQAKDILTEILSGRVLMEKPVKIVVKSVTKVSGDSDIHVVRGKCKVGYEMEIEFKFYQQDGDISGKLKIPDIDSTDPSGFDILLSSWKGSKVHEKDLKKQAKESIMKAMQEMAEKLL